MRTSLSQQVLTTSNGRPEANKIRIKSRAVIVFLFSLSLAISSCKLPSSDGGNNQTSSKPANGNATSSPARSVSTSDNPVDVLLRAVRAQNDAKSYRSHLEVRMAGELEQSSNFEYVAPDRYHSSKVSVTGLQTNGETIIIGKDAWTMRHGKFEKLPFDMSKGLAEVHSTLNSSLNEDKMKGGDVRLVGADTVEGTPTLAYRYTVNTVVDDQKTNLNVEVWISVAEGLIRKEELVDNDNRRQVLTFTDYNSDIKIEPPM